MADATGAWSLQRDPEAASLAEHTITVASAEQQLTGRNVSFGEVFLCAGAPDAEADGARRTQSPPPLPPLPPTFRLYKVGVDARSAPGGGRRRW